MADFGMIEDATYREASVVMRAVSGRGPKPEVEVMPGFENMVAGAAIAMEKGAPNLIADTVPLSAAGMFEEGTREYGMLNRSVARAIDVHRRKPWHFEEPNDVMNHVASDMWMQGRASRMDLAISNSHEAFQEGLTASEKGVVRYAREDDLVKADVAAQVTGSYERLDAYSQREVGRDLFSGEVLPKEVRDSISQSYAIVSDGIERTFRTADRMDRLGDLHDFSMPVFRTPLPEHHERAQALVEGRTQPVGEIDKAIVAHAALSARQAPDELGSGFAVSAGRRGDVDRVDAYARALSDFGDRGERASQIALRIEADLSAVTHARRLVALDPDRAADPDMVNIAQRQRYAELPIQRQAALYSELEDGSHVPGMAALRLGHGVAAVASGELGIAREAAVRDVEPTRPRPDVAARAAVRHADLGRG